MRASIVAYRTPLIRFIGKRSVPSTLDHSLRAHPEGPGELPSSFAQYRQKAQTHGPLARSSSTSAPADSGVHLSVSDLPKRFHYSQLSEAELENINSGGAFVVF